MATENKELEPLTVTVKEAKRLSGLSQSTLYEMMADGRLIRTKIGSRTLITYASLKKLLAPQMEAAQ